jgi:hypothetical protein
MLRLFSILYTTIEPNVTLKALTSFKRYLVETLSSVASSLVSAIPSFTPNPAAEFLSVQGSLVVGTYPMTNLTEKQREAMAEVGMETDPTYYRGVLEHAVALLLGGLTGKDVAV